MNKKNTIICAIILMIIIVAIIYLSNRSIIGNGKIENYKPIEKKYNINEYTLINITDKEKANMYLMDYKDELINNKKKSYEHLNKEYKEKKFKNENEYYQYIENMDIYSISLNKYAFDKNGTYLLCYTNKNQKIIFKIKDIYDYEVYLDDETIELK